MKTATAYYSACRTAAYPNAATRRQVLQKLVDHLLLGACGVGITAMVLLALVLF